MRFHWAERANEPEPDALEANLLAEAEEAAFAESVRAARNKAMHAAEPARPTAPVHPPEPAIEWHEREDVYRPSACDLREWLHERMLPIPQRLGPAHPMALIRPGAMAAIAAHTGSDVSRELGGLLLGMALWDGPLQAWLTLIGEAVPALGGEETPTSFTYTPAAWAAVTPRLVSLPQNWTVVGSYHSHPRMGVFLSPVDLDTQRDVFRHDWQVALVIDPVAGERGLFFGEHGKPCMDWRIVEWAELPPARTPGRAG